MTRGDTLDDVQEALLATGIPISTAAVADGSDLVIDPHGVQLSVDVKHRSLVDEAVAKELLRNQRDGMTLVVVADRVTAGARALLLEGEAGYLDRRGHLAIRSKGIFIKSDITPSSRQTTASDPLVSTAGKEVACALLTQPLQPFSVRGLAAELGRAPSTVSAILARLRANRLVDNENALADPQTLFWQLATHWSTPPTYLHQAPAPGSPFQLSPLRLGLTNLTEPGWALTSDIAAAVFGAPVAVASGQLREFYVPDRSIVRRATTLLGQTASAVDALCTVRVAPVAAICGHRVDVDHNPTEWPLAHPVYVALDLAQDAGRGQEILRSWDPNTPWHRVW